MVSPPACARYSPGRSRRVIAAALRHHPGLAADPPSCGDLSARHGRCANAVATGYDCVRVRAPGRIGQTYAIKYNPEHKWYWFPRMRREEAYVFKVFDSMKDGRARWTAHTAFEDPTTPPHARPRESIEIRTMAFF